MPSPTGPSTSGRSSVRSPPGTPAPEADRTETLDAALELAAGRIATVWSVEEEDVRLARSLADEHPGLGARDLLHLAACRRREVDGVKTFDRGLAAAFD